MAASFKELTAFFREIGAADVGHTSKTYLAHCIGVHGERWGQWDYRRAAFERMEQHLGGIAAVFASRLK